MLGLDQIAMFSQFPAKSNHLDINGMLRHWVIWPMNGVDDLLTSEDSIRIACQEVQ